MSNQRDKIAKETKVLDFSNSVENYIKIAEKRTGENRSADALGYYFSALKKEPKNLSVISALASHYSEMGLYEQSNKFWFYYLSMCSDDGNLSVAYEQLGENYFYLDNFWVSSYYFHKKISMDGFISPQTLSDELSDFLSQSIDIRSAYHIAYPHERADYTFRIKGAKRAFNSGDYASACVIYSSVPKECLDEESCGEYAMSLFMCKEDKKVVDTCKYSLENHGENLTAYCNLATLYMAKGNKEKSAYYYNKALESRKGAEDEVYKLATCAIEQGDHLIAEQCIEGVLKDRVYDPIMLFYSGVSKVNKGNFLGGAEMFKKAYRICPYDKVLEYFAMYFERASLNNADTDNICPLKYEKKYPDKIIRKYKRFIKSVENKDIISVLRDPNNIEILGWGLVNGDESSAKTCSAILAFSGEKKGQAELMKLLLDIEVSDERKRLIIFTLIVCKYTKKISLTAGGYFVKFKPRKIVCADNAGGELFLSAYAYAMSRMAFSHVEDLDKIAFNVNKAYKEYSDVLITNGFECEEIAVIAIFMCNFSHIKDVKKLCKSFGVKPEKVVGFLNAVKGDKDDKVD